MGLAELLAIAPVARSVESSGGEDVGRDTETAVKTMVLPIAHSAPLIG